MRLTEFNAPIDYSNTIFKMLQEDRLRKEGEREAIRFTKEQDPNSIENQFKVAQMKNIEQTMAKNQEEAKNAVVNGYFKSLNYVEPNQEDYTKFYDFYSKAGIPSFMMRKPDSFLKEPDINGKTVFDEDAFKKYKSYVFDVYDMANGKIDFDTVDVDIPTGKEGEFRTIKYPARKGKIFDPAVIATGAKIHEKEGNKRLYSVNKDGKTIYTSDAEGKEVGVTESPVQKAGLDIRRRELSLKEEEQRAKKEKGNLGGGGKFKWTGQLSADGKSMLVYNEETKDSEYVPLPQGVKAKPAPEKEKTPIQKELESKFTKRKAQELAKSGEYEEVRISGDKIITKKKGEGYKYHKE